MKNRGARLPLVIVQVTALASSLSTPAFAAQDQMDRTIESDQDLILVYKITNKGPFPIPVM